MVIEFDGDDFVSDDIEVAFRYLLPYMVDNINIDVKVL